MWTMFWLLLPSVAHGWPADAEWTPLMAGGAEAVDDAGDHTAGDGSLDLVGEAAEPALRWFADGDALFLRLRVADDPLDGAVLQSQTWGFVVDLDGDNAFEYAIVTEGTEGILTVYANNGTPGTQPGAGAYTAIGAYGSLAGGEVRAVGGPTEPFFLDLYLSRTDLQSDLGIGNADPLRLTAVAGPALTEAWADVSGCAGACATLSDGLADAVYLDHDGDGLTDPEEVAAGTLLEDADTDDDGLLDGEEPGGDADGDGVPNRLDCDSDADGLHDGTEAGRTHANRHADTDSYSPCFVPDADPGAPDTDPYVWDSDGGGLSDGQEDWNHNGAVDLPWETDPTAPADDVDTDGDTIADALEWLGADADADDADSDGDGLPDANEWLYDADGDGLPNFLDTDSDGDGRADADETDVDSDADGVPDYLDTDSDGDGLADALEGAVDSDGDGLPDALDTDSDEDGIGDATEGEADTDGDGQPDYLDLDSDGDGLSDAFEGDGDPDEDGIGNWRDLDSDADGLADSVEGEADTDADEIPDFIDTDSDGDRIPDAEEGLTDGDCDGVVDYLDDTNEDSFCDPGQAIPEVKGGGAGDDVGGLNGKRGQFTGGACSTVPLGGLWWPSLLAAVLLACRRRRGVAALLLVAPTASAQAIDAQRLRPSVDGGPWVGVEDSHTEEAFSGGLGMWLNYADDPLVYRRSAGEEIAVLGAVGTMDLVGFYSLGAVHVGVDVPVHLYTTGVGITRPTQLGDLRWTAKARLWSSDNGLSVGAYADLSLPTGNGQAHVGAGEARLRGGGITTVQIGRFTSAVDLGVQSGTGTAVGALTVGPGLEWRVGGAMALAEPIGVAVELNGEQWLGNAGQAGARPAEWLTSARLHTGERTALHVGAGSGLSSGVGAPDFRLVAGLHLGRPR